MTIRPVSIALACVFLTTVEARQTTPRDPRLKPFGPSHQTKSLPSPSVRSTGGVGAATRSDFAALPLSFEANLGQLKGTARFFARADGYNVAITPSGAEFTRQGTCSR